jgi:regulator of RNase E activity RraA
MIGCGGVLVVPGDIVVGDPDGVVVVPRHLAAQVACEGRELEEVERWIKTEVEKGGRASDLYPPDETVVARFREAQRKQD